MWRPQTKPPQRHTQLVGPTRPLEASEELRSAGEGWSDYSSPKYQGCDILILDVIHSTDIFTNYLLCSKLT